VTDDWKTQKRQNGQQGGGGDGTPVSKNGYDKGEVVSALQKAIRRGEETRALYWAQELMESGETYRMWRRLIVIAAEDVGVADPDMVMRIWAMNQAHNVGREANIPFLAVMLLCRAKKNREADDACYLYELRFKEGWKIPMPPEAVDGHTRRGRGQLYEMARQQGKDWADLWNEEFYYDVALLRDYEPDTATGIDDPYRRALMDYLKIPYETYDVETCKQPRLRTGGAARKAQESLLGARVPNGLKVRDTADVTTGEVATDAIEVQSFSDPETWYRVTWVDVGGGNLEPETCTCPAFANSGDGLCKHMMGVRKWLVTKVADDKRKAADARTKANQR
jgi:hypothetical protein